MSDVSGPGESLPVWSEDGRGVFSLASDSGATHVYRIDLETKTVEKRTEGERRIAGFQVLDGERFVVLSGDASYPFELALVDAAQECQLTTHNADFLAEVELAPAMEFRSHNPVDGKEIQGWVLHPPGFDEAKETKYPLVVQIHGGPHAMYGQAMFHEMQLMAAHGYVVLFTNPRGSSGYGEEFTSCTRGTWGESDMPDVMAALDTLVAKGYVDEQRMGVTGGSYGGYLTNWIIGHTDRFRAAATQRCVSDVVSFYGTSDIGFTFGEYEFDGTPWDQYERLRHHSPITYVESMKTPLLIIHSEQDLRCPIEQGEQLFIALKRLGRETTFVRIPDESHNLSRNGTPSRRLARLHHLLTWFDQQL
jgi:dipeptidyl aminopeptidase/acylaminoacyl peptidase